MAVTFLVPTAEEFIGQTMLELADNESFDHALIALDVFLEKRGKLLDDPKTLEEAKKIFTAVNQMVGFEGEADPPQNFIARILDQFIEAIKQDDLRRWVPVRPGIQRPSWLLDDLIRLAALDGAFFDDEAIFGDEGEHCGQIELPDAKARAELVGVLTQVILEEDLPIDDQGLMDVLTLPEEAVIMNSLGVIQCQSTNGFITTEYYSLSSEKEFDQRWEEIREGLPGPEDDEEAGEADDTRTFPSLTDDDIRNVLLELGATDEQVSSTEFDLEEDEDPHVRPWFERVSIRMNDIEGSSQAVDRFFAELDKVLPGSFGVESIQLPDGGAPGLPPRDGWWMGTHLAYLNAGDTYSTTLGYDTVQEVFFIGSWGGWLEEWEQTFGA